MSSKLNNLIVRTLTGIVFVAALVGGIVYSPISFGALFLLITVLSTWEFCNIVNQKDNVRVNPFITTVASVCLFSAFYVYASGMILSHIVFIPYLVTLIYLLVSELYVGRENALNTWAYTMMSQLYVALPFAMLCPLSFMPSPVSPTGMVYVWSFPLAVFLFLWCSDSGAYCVGSLLGRKIPYRLFPSISPNKSWIGSIGGGILTVLVAILVSYYEPSLTMLQWIGFGLVVCIFGTWGDLVESQIKRQLGIKDSGNVLPGHGGMLDRFDSSLLAIPAALIYIYTLWCVI